METESFQIKAIHLELSHTKYPRHYEQRLGCLDGGWGYNGRRQIQKDGALVVEGTWEILQAAWNFRESGARLKSEVSHLTSEDGAPPYDAYSKNIKK